jgi:FHS family L-fucose permease-like MFS transporter
MLVFVFESCCFATISTMSLRGLGKHTKRGGSWLVAAISGGVCPSMTGQGGDQIQRPRCHADSHDRLYCWYGVPHLRQSVSENRKDHSLTNNEVGVTYPN